MVEMVDGQTIYPPELHYINGLQVLRVKLN